MKILKTQRGLAAVMAITLTLGACASDTNAASDAATDSPDTSAGARTSGTSATQSRHNGEDEPVPSSGCGDQDPALAATTEGTFTSGGTERTYLLGVPSSNDGETPMPLVVDMHGFGEPIDLRAASGRMPEVGEREGFVSVLPQGLGSTPVLVPTRGAGSDAAYINELLDSLETGLCLDTSRFYLTGYSGGAMVAALLSCDDADRFAASAPVGAQVVITDCDPTRPVPVRAFHGTDDPMLGFDGGNILQSMTVLSEVFGEQATAAVMKGADGTVDPIMLTDEAPGTIEVVTAWAGRNGCADTYIEEPAADHVRRLVWDNCAADASTELYVVDGGGHTWPGSDAPTLDESILGSTTFEIDATELMWDFFQQHHL